MSHFPNHARSKVRVSAGRPIGIANMAYWVEVGKNSFSERTIDTG